MLNEFCVAVSFYLVAAWALDNGLAPTPPMGWMPWERFRCLTNCAKFPMECISESLFKRTADLLVAEGYAAVGYKYVIVDDCWMERRRDKTTIELLPNRRRFPSGLNALSHYIHDKGLKFGLYHDVGERTCMHGGPGAVDHFQLDAHTFAAWGVDYVKLDGCYAKPAELDSGYPNFGQALNATGRSMVYSCSWPFYKAQPDYELVRKHCNLWRFAEDIHDSFESVFSIMGHYYKRQHILQRVAGPGHWNDPDMLVLGNYHLSYDASRLQLAIWAVLAAPLIMTNDLATVRPEIKALLQNRDIIAVDQDPLGIAGRCALIEDKIQVWLRPILPLNDLDQYSYAVAFVNEGGYAPCPLCPATYEVALERLSLNNPMGYVVVDLFNSSENIGLFKPKDAFSTRINPEGVTFYKFTPAPFY